MPPMKKDDGKNRNIKDFFKPFTIPKSRIPAYDVEEEIVVATAPSTSPEPDLPSLPALMQRTDSRSSQSSGLSSAPSGKPKRSPAKRKKIAQLDGAEDDAAHPPSLPSSQRRIVKAVEILSAKPVQHEQLRPQEHSKTATTSFSSFSSLSSVPLSTQSSSRRVVKHGVQAITNSDSDSIESSSSDDELADPSTFIPRKKPRLETPGKDVGSAIELPSTVKQTNRQSTRLSDGSKRSSRMHTPAREATPPKMMYKHSLINMVRQRERDEKADSRMREMEQEFEQASQVKMDDNEGTTPAWKAAIAEDSDDGERMMLAMQRTEAGESEERFFYFRGVKSGIVEAPFPGAGIKNDSRAWIRKLDDETWRTQALLTGSLAAVVAKQGLPPALRDWFAFQLLHEQREDLCEAYLAIFKACREGESTEGLHCLHTLQTFYDLCDTTTEPTGRQHRTAQESDSPPLALNRIIRLVQHFSIRAGGDAIASLISELVLASIDSNVKAEAALSQMIKESIADLLERASHKDSPFQKIAANLTSSTHSTGLKCRAIASLPAYSKQSHALRRYLALNLVTGQILPEPVHSPQHAEAVLQTLKHAPELRISDSTDYLFLNSFITILDVAIDNGFYDADFHHENAEAPRSPRKKKDDPRDLDRLAAEKAFNAQIDAFVSQLTLMSSRIKDAGTTHLRRTEAKHSIERLIRRLEYAVRTKVRPRKTVFGGIVGEIQKGFLSDFLQRADVTIQDVDVGGASVADQSEDSILEGTERIADTIH